MSVEIYPVVHIKDEVQGVDQALTALNAQADGVYLIDHNSDDVRLLGTVFNSLTREVPDRFIGINILQVQSAIEAFRLIQNMSDNGDLSRLPSGLWVDDASFRPFETRTFRDQHQELRSVRYLGGVAFKYTRLYTDSPTKAAQQARSLGPFVDVVTTTGSATGHAATIEKVRAIRQAISPQELAVASGVSIENITEFATVVDQILVATSIETYPGSGTFEISKLEDLIETAHQ